MIFSCNHILVCQLCLGAMSWIRESKQPWFQNLCANVLKMGPIPKHVAFIMDGNRRFAQKRNYDRAKGHLMGFDKLAEVCELWFARSAVKYCIKSFFFDHIQNTQERS